MTCYRYCDDCKQNNTYAILVIFRCKTIINTILHLIKDIFRSKNNTKITFFIYPLQIINRNRYKILIYFPDTPIVLFFSNILSLILKDNIFNISNIGTFPDFFPQASLYASTYHTMSIEINFAFHNLIKFRLGIYRIFLLKYTYNIAI